MPTLAIAISKLGFHLLFFASQLKFNSHALAGQLCFGADGPTLFRSIREQILTLDDDFVVYPGHGPATEIGFERENNPFVGAYSVAAEGE